MRLICGLLLLCCFCLTLAAEASSETKPKPIDYDALLAQLVLESNAEWNSYIDIMKEDGEDEDLIKAEEASRDTYAATLNAIKASKDVRVKRAMVLYEYTYFVSTALGDLAYAEELQEKLVATAKLAANKKRLKEFKEMVAAEDAAKAEPQGKKVEPKK